jgi:hypothetical protein
MNKNIEDEDEDVEFKPMLVSTFDDKSVVLPRPDSQLSINQIKLLAGGQCRLCFNFSILDAPYRMDNGAFLIGGDPQCSKHLVPPREDLCASFDPNPEKVIAKLADK